METNPNPSNDAAVTPNSDTKIGVMVVEDQTAIRHMLSAFVGAMPGFAVVGQAGDIPEALRIAEECRPRVVVLDWMLLGGVGLDFLRQIRIEPPPYVLVFSANTTELAIREALSAGAKGYIEKTASFTEFTHALKAVSEGRTYLGPVVSKTVRRIVANPERAAATVELSARERDVLRFVAEGQSSKEIAECLGLSVRTVENHRASITRRTGLKSVAQLTLHAVRLGLIAMPSGPELEKDGAS
jgi:DNA-binding NarL/FixJ family response regulator